MEPVLVIHGIANRDPDGWRQAVEDFGQRFRAATGNSNFQFLPVYWGDLAARTENLDACMPALEPVPSFSVPQVSLQNAKVTDLMNLINRLPAIAAAPIKAKLEAALNQVAGDAIRSHLAQQYQTARVTNRHMITTSLGDIMVYQRNQAAIQGRVWEVLKAFDVRKTGYSTSRKSVHVVAHSLGGVIAVDTIIRGKLPLHAKSLTTFGSQFPYFHLVDPRPTIPAYAGQPIVMPPQLKRWINLWEPLDPLSFVASKMFQLSSGKPVIDIQVRPEGGMTDLLQGHYYTHNIYWQTQELLDAIKQNLLS